jgi:antitoxin (DNA-binding transcriptional repressor) of toxin-antitoxin stability system
MKRTTVPVGEFKARCLLLLDDIAANGRTLVITKRGKPIAKVSPVEAKRKPFAGSGKGMAKEVRDIVYFDTSDLWEALK